MLNKEAPKKRNADEKANERAKEIGFYNLGELEKFSFTSRQTLNNWFNKNRDRFETIMKGAMINKMESKPDGEIRNG